MKDPENIILKMPNWIGDAVMGTPLIRDLKERFPNARLTALCQSNIAPLFEKDPRLSDLISYKKPSGWIHRAEHKDVIRPLQMGEYDLGILLTNSFSSAWWFYRGNVKERIGFGSFWRSWLLTKSVPWPKNVEKEHLVETYKRLLEPLGISRSLSRPELFLSAEDKEFAREFFKLQQITAGTTIIGINPGAAYGTAKCWPPEKFVEVTKRLSQKDGVCILFFGDKSSEPMIESICAGMPKNVINVAGKTELRQLMALIASCSVFLTNDSGPMHIASALGVPLLALFGSTNDTKTGPYNGGVVLHKHVECSPCYKRVCPIDFRCMQRITSEEVYQELLKLIEPWPKH